VLPLADAQQRLLAAEDELLFVGHALTSHDSNPAAAVAELTPPLDWSRLESEATRQFEAHARNNPFSVDDDWWAENAGWTASQKNQSSDAQFQDDLSRSETWIDLEQLLQLTQALNAKVLILSMPFDARFMAYTGVSKAALHKYYERVRAAVSMYGARAVIFDDHESDSFFFYDLWSHISPKGWVYFDQALDSFYHDRLH